jgi:chromosome segregation protein
LARLKQLEINGFKSFANPTTFVFDRGITAIIGPNGSGKSNIAEALRWVLGEQQYSALRGRRTEDVIFAGSDRRGRLGMAEVALTIDNSSGLLPIEFTELTVTRRAHRSGENQYLINGNRVRLKDLQQLTAPLGQAHTIIGQGLVDAVLSQRPEDRRGLFEHAAGITGLRMQALNAERGLLEADENARRLQDIVGELEPRVRSLSRRARQAEQYESVRAELTALQRGYYGALWVQAGQRLRQAGKALAEADARLAAREHAQTEAVSTLASLKERERKTGGRRASLAEQIADLESRLAELRHTLALSHADARSTGQRAEDRRHALKLTLDELGARKTAIEALDTGLAEQRAELESLEARHAEQTARHDAARHKRLELQNLLGDLDRQLLDLRQRGSQLEARLAGNAERRAILERSATEAERRVEEVAARMKTAEREAAELDDQRARAEAAVQKARADRDATERALDEIERSLRTSAAEQQQHEREREKLGTRLELLERIWFEGEGLHAGVRAVLRAARRGDLELPGLIGTVTETVDVPAEYETAIEVALGGHLQDVIVRSWADAEAGITHLKRTGAGRARFQPLDTLRGNSRSRRRPPASDPGLIERAVKLVSFDAEIGAVVEQLLGGTLVVSDLDAAHRIAQAGEGWTIVTLQGEIVSPSGSVTGGARVRAAGLLARERERRELPARIATIERQLDRIRRQSDAERERQETLVARLGGSGAELGSARAEERQIRELLTALARELAEQRAERERGAQEQAKLKSDLENLDSASLSLDAERAELACASQATEERRAGVSTQLAELPDSVDPKLAAMTAELATLRERVRSTERERQALTRQIEAAERATTERRLEIKDIEARQLDIEIQVAETERAIGEVEKHLDGARSSLTPVVRELDGLTTAIAGAERDAAAAAADLRDAERSRDRISLDLARAEDAAALLRERIRDDLEIDEPCELVGQAGEASAEVEEQIRRLRERLRRIGAVGDDVLAEYQEEAARLDYLTGQIADVEGAADSLRRVLADLRQQMAGRFSATFEEVASEFEATFQRLFGGGTARLSHEMDEGDPGGIDIIARPPGKRLQGLNQLSGGERALTAVALLIAIQRVNPSPFCLLDEVDAALDESNVIRFRQELRELARDTQYIVITHNRGTIEGADTLYGVTMGDDSISRVLSLRLDQAIQAIEDEQLLEMESVI